MAEEIKPSVLQFGTVKQVLSGDTIVIRGVAKNGPPPERTICLAGVSAPRLGIRGNERVAPTKDEPVAWESRDFLRRCVVGQSVMFTVEYTVSNGREFCCVYVGGKTIESSVNVTEAMISEGLLRVRGENNSKLLAIQAVAQGAGKGIHGDEETLAKHVREVQYNFENPRALVDHYKHQPIDAIVEHVRDATTLRVTLLPKHQYLTIVLTGVKAPGFKREDSKEVPEPFAEEAKYFVETRLLQREVKVVLEGITGTGNFLGSILHPAGNISEFLIREGFAKIADWSIGNIVNGRERLRGAETAAKAARIRLWASYSPSEVVSAITEKHLSGVVTEILAVDNLLIETDNGPRKIQLSSLRPPKAAPKTEEEGAQSSSQKKRTSLFDTPHMYDAREFLRKKLIGQKVSVNVDYIKPAANGFPEKICGTVMFEGINMAEALVSKGLATVLRLRGDDDQRSAKYDDLLAAETRAVKNQKGVHDLKESSLIRVTDVTSKAVAERFLPSLKRATRQTCVVEYVSSGARLRLYAPKESCIFTILLAGISCPRTPMGEAAGEPMSLEATEFTKRLVMQREVEVDVFETDKSGNFVGAVSYKGEDLSVLLLQNGLSSLHFSAERYPNYAAKAHAEQIAKDKRLGVFVGYDAEAAAAAALAAATISAPAARHANYVSVIVTDVSSPTSLCVQPVSAASAMDKLMGELAEHCAQPAMTAGFVPKKNDLVAAQFSADRCWYRAKVMNVTGTSCEITYIDYGNSESVPVASLRPLPGSLAELPGQARRVKLALVDTSADYTKEATEYLSNGILNAKFLLNTEYRDAEGIECVTLIDNETNKQDVTCTMLYAGFLLVTRRREGALQDLIKSYMTCQAEARASRLGMWRHGDISDDESRSPWGAGRR